MTDNKNLHCSFCGKSRSEVDKLIAGPNVYICNECIVLSYNIVVEESSQSDKEFDLKNLPTPQEIKEHFDSHIIGHNDTKELLAVSTYNHYKRLQSDSQIDKSNVLLIGATGTGKTLFAKTLAKKLHVPFAIADATTLTEAGYVGEDVESVLERLLSVADYDIEHAQQGIIYIDEIDKKARRGESNTSTRDVSGEGVQQALLRLIEGTTTKVKVGSGKKLVDEYIEFNTDNVLFILSGAFVGIENIIEKRLKKKSKIGFNSTLNDIKKDSDVLRKLDSEDIIEFGLIPELVGRVPVIASLDKLSQKDLLNILTNVKNSIIIQTKELLKIDDIDIEFSETYLETLSNLAIKSKLGARSLKGYVENSVFNCMYRIKELKEKDIVAIRFNDYPLSDDKYPVLINKDNQEMIDTNYKLYRGFDEV